MLIDNTNRVLNIAQPGTFLRSRGKLSGLGAWPDAEPGFDFQSAISAVNAEGLYLLNLYRLNQGLPPIPPQHAAPSFNVGLTPAMMVGIGVIAYLLLSRR